MNLNGDWYLVYLEYDHTQPDSLARNEARIKLMVINQEQAKKTGVLVWQARVDQGIYRGGDGQTYPQRPRIILEIPLSADPPPDKPARYSARIR